VIETTTPSTHLLPRLEAAMDAMRRAVMNARDRLSSGLQVSRTQLEILLILAHQPGQTVGELARRLFLTQSAVTQTLDTLVRRALVERRPDEHDRRIIRLEVSAAGHAIINQVQQLRRRHLEGLMAQLSPTETEVLIAATQKLAAYIESTQCPSPHREA
jgi:DNA-binding MarR family transcriptional regulator